MMYDGIMSTNSGSSMEPMQVATNSSNDICKHECHESTPCTILEALILSPSFCFGSTH